MSPSICELHFLTHCVGTRSFHIRESPECLPNQEEPCQAPDGTENFAKHINKKRSLFMNTFHKPSRLKRASVKCTGRQIDTCNPPSRHTVAKETLPGVWQTHRGRRRIQNRRRSIRWPGQTKLFLMRRTRKVPVSPGSIYPIRSVV